jgi:hypothetical protein
MTETEVRKLYLKTLDQAHRCVWELSEIRKSAHLLSYLSKQKTVELFKLRDSEITRRLISKNVACHIVVRLHATCFEGGRQRMANNLTDWELLLSQRTCSLNSIVCFLSHDHEEAIFIKNLAIWNHALHEFSALNREKLNEIGLAGERVPIDSNTIHERLLSLHKKIAEWRELSTDPCLNKLVSLRDSLFAHNEVMPEEWLDKNEIKSEELLAFIERVWAAASGILALLLYGVIKIRQIDMDGNMARLLLASEAECNPQRKEIT